MPTTQRRTQAERSAATREALLDATIACLVKDGYTNTTTTRVAERAGVSRGAHLHHFQTRSALVAAAVGHLAQRRAATLEQLADTLPSGRERLSQGLDLMWQSAANPLFQAALALWTQARTDPELREHLVDIERELEEQTLLTARLLLRDYVDHEDFEQVVQLAVATMRGLALMDTLHPDGKLNRAHWPACRTLLMSLFERFTA